MRAFLFTLMLLGGCTGVPPIPTHDGHLYEYVRSNRDGSRPETILVYLPSPDRVEVVKIAAPCTDAAYVTAQVDPATGTPLRLDAGRLEVDGSQRVIGFMEYDPASRRLRYELGPDEPLTGELAEVPPRWHLYDFDLATLVSDAHYRWRPGSPARFDLVRLMSGEHGELLFENLGAVALDPKAADDITGAYRVSGPALPQGLFARRRTDGAITLVSSSRRNHAEYADFLLRLKDDRSATQLQWAERRAAHWAGCD